MQAHSLALRGQFRAVEVSPAKRPFYQEVTLETVHFLRETSYILSLFPAKSKLSTQGGPVF